MHAQKATGKKLVAQCLSRAPRHSVPLCLRSQFNFDERRSSIDVVKNSAQTTPTIHYQYTMGELYMYDIMASTLVTKRHILTSQALKRLCLTEPNTLCTLQSLCASVDINELHHPTSQWATSLLLHTPICPFLCPLLLLWKPPVLF